MRKLDGIIGLQAACVAKVVLTKSLRLKSSQHLSYGQKMAALADGGGKVVILFELRLKSSFGLGCGLGWGVWGSVFGMEKVVEHLGKEGSAAFGLGGNAVAVATRGEGLAVIDGVLVGLGVHGVPRSGLNAEGRKRRPRGADGLAALLFLSLLQLYGFGGNYYAKYFLRGSGWWDAG